MITISGYFCQVIYLNETIKSDHLEQLITVTVITLSGFHCIDETVRLGAGLMLNHLSVHHLMHDHLQVNLVIINFTDQKSQSFAKKLIT